MSIEEIWQRHLALLSEWYKVRPEFNETKDRLTQEAEGLRQQIQSLERLEQSAETPQLAGLRHLRHEYEEVQKRKFSLIADRDELLRQMLTLERELLNDSELR